MKRYCLQQQGIASVLFLMMVPVLLGLMIFCLEGGRYLRTKAVLGDAAEAAALMVSAAEYQSSDQSRQLAGAWVRAMVSDSNSLTARVKSLPCHDNPDCSGKTRDRTFVEHQLMVISAHDSWFAKGQAPTFAKEQHLQHKAISRKYVQGQAVDVLFVADFSGSMRGRWMGERKIAMLKRTLGKLALTIESQTAGVVDPHYKNTVALIPFGSTTQELTQDNQICSTSQTQHENVQWGIDHLFAVKECESRIPLAKAVNFDARPYYIIPPTRDAQKLRSTMGPMGSWGGTASYEGIIRAAQIAMTTSNPRRLIIILSDGNDEDIHYHREMVDRGYCNRIRDVIGQQRTPDGEPVTAEIAVIGFDYDVQRNESLYRCADKGKLFSAEHPDDVFRSVLAVIREDVGHLYQP